MMMSPTCPFRIVSNLGQVTQVRNHSKIYPWRFNRANRECYLDPTRTPYTDRFNINEFTHKKQKKPWMLVVPKDKDNRFNSFTWNDAYRSDPKEARETAESKMRRFQDVLRNRGSARESRPYQPAENVQERIVSICKSLLIESPTANSEPTTDEDILALELNQATRRSLKLNLLRNCIEEFNHDMPGSYLNDILKVSDVVEYFSTPVRGVNPYTAMLRQDDSLPVNLALISEPIRFDRERDTFFKGYTALPGVVDTVPGLRASKKYAKLNQDEFQWPDI